MNFLAGLLIFMGIVGCCAVEACISKLFITDEPSPIDTEPESKNTPIPTAGPTFLTTGRLLITDGPRPITIQSRTTDRSPRPVEVFQGPTNVPHSTEVSSRSTNRPSTSAGPLSTKQPASTTNNGPSPTTSPRSTKPPTRMTTNGPRPASVPASTKQPVRITTNHRVSPSAGPRSTKKVSRN